MSNLHDMLVLLALGTTVGVWLKLSTARERAVREARAQCLQHGLQLLDETVGLRGIRLRRVNGLRRVERCYYFEVSIDGHDREPGRLWMIGSALSSLSLPVIEHVLPPADPSEHAPHAVRSNVVVLPPRPRLPTDRLQ
ncbi:MAG TPA: DUF3301 domain-containing protein [Rhodanobacter sp.]|jgi:Protein of unknown function (DUF3301).